MNQQKHQSDAKVLTRRTLERDHRRLAAVLEAGMSVLDVGCGPGTITAGIARRVGPVGKVVGIDRDDSLLSLARQQHCGLPNLEFEQVDIVSLGVENRFDVATAARVLQWISAPDVAVRRMAAAGQAEWIGSRPRL